MADRMAETGWHQLVNGTSIVLDQAGILLTGAPGCGKSDLALRLIDRGAALIADDLTELRRRDGGLVACYPGVAPDDLRGRMEVRGLGIMSVGHVTEPQILRLVVDLVPAAAIERLPEPAERVYGGISVPYLQVAPFEASAPAKLRLAVAALAGHIMAPL
ncbi:MAG: serine kinase [Dongiaceae bacterium]